MDLWQIEVILGKVIQHHDCEKCKIKTTWYLTVILDTKTNTKYLVWWCGYCKSEIHEDIGPYVPN